MKFINYVNITLKFINYVNITFAPKYQLIAIKNRNKNKIFSLTETDSSSKYQFMKILRFCTSSPKQH